MFDHLQIYDARERTLVGMADLALRVMTAPGRARRRQRPARVDRILLLRAERTGDLLMTRPAIAAVRALAPSARIDLVVGSWNEPLARLIPGLDTVQVLDLPWLSRGTRASGMPAIRRQIRSWRAARYDLGINFEGDIRTHALLWAARVRWRAGFDMAGGGPLLNRRAAFDPLVHTSENALRLVACVFGVPEASLARRVPPLDVPAAALAFADQLLAPIRAAASGTSRLLIAVHASGGRQVKQWSPERFAAATATVARHLEAAVVLTGAAGERAVVDEMRAHLPTDVPALDLVARLDLVQLGAVLQRMHLVISGDTGPMHLAAAVGTPVVGVFGPSDPRRWGPGSRLARAVRVDLPCSPCNRIRRPPERCTGHIPDCLMAVTPEMVVAAAQDLLGSDGRERGRHGPR